MAKNNGEGIVFFGILVGLILYIAKLIYDQSVKPKLNARAATRKLDKLPDGKEMLTRLRNKLTILSPESVDIPITPSNEAYTIGKKQIFLCFLDEKGLPYDENTILYAAIHELAHVITPTYDEHGPDFRENFQKLLDRAAYLGLLYPGTPIHPQYCQFNKKQGQPKSLTEEKPTLGFRLRKVQKRNVESRDGVSYKREKVDPC